MIIFDTEQLICVDVDNTLLMWGKRDEDFDAPVVEFKDIREPT